MINTVTAINEIDNWDFNYKRQNNNYKHKLIITHNAGFFSCSSIALYDILHFYNKYNCLPDEIDRSSQYAYFKNYDNEDIASTLFRNPAETFVDLLIVNKVFFQNDHIDPQYTNYKAIFFEKIRPFINKYFYPSDLVEDIVSAIISKYKIDLYNTCAVFYRGNDKYRETQIATYQDFIDKAKQYPNMKFFVLPDEAEFWDSFHATYPNSCRVEESGMMSKKDSCLMYELPKLDRTKHALWYFASVIVASRCEYVITHSGNGGLWMSMYRGHKNGIVQYLNGEWI